MASPPPSVGLRSDGGPPPETWAQDTGSRGGNVCRGRAAPGAGSWPGRGFVPGSPRASVCRGRAAPGAGTRPGPGFVPGSPRASVCRGRAAPGAGTWRRGLGSQEALPYSRAVSTTHVTPVFLPLARPSAIFHCAAPCLIRARVASCRSVGRPSDCLAWAGKVRKRHAAGIWQDGGPAAWAARLGRRSGQPPHRRSAPEPDAQRQNPTLSARTRRRTPRAGSRTSAAAGSRRTGFR